MLIKKVVGIASCKGGVGKSTIAVNLAVLLSMKYKLKIGLLDGDIYGPNHPGMLGIDNKNLIDIKKQLLIPRIKYNLLSMSMGYFIKKNSAVLLRGPMASNTINYLFKNTKWGNLDILIIDFPPGTGDIYLSLLRDIKIDGVFLVTIPSLSSFEDIYRSISMLDKFNIKILGLIENMKYYQCRNCYKTEYIYGYRNNIKILKEKILTPIYEFPLDSNIAYSLEIRKPIVIQNSLKNVSLIFNKIVSLLIKDF